MRNDLKLISMKDVQAEEVRWLWYPYIPLGKLTIVQGDPGEGKTTFVLVVGRLKEDPTVRIVAQDKNSLAPEGKSIAFRLDGERGFQWKGLCELTVDDVLGGGGKLQTKATQMEEELRQMLTETVPAEAVLRRAKEPGISERTLMTAKKNLGVLSERRGGQWYWKLPAQGCKAVED